MLSSSSTMRMLAAMGALGAGGVTRTRDLTLTKRLLYQLSYTSRAVNYNHPAPPPKGCELFRCRARRCAVRSAIPAASRRLLRRPGAAFKMPNIEQGALMRQNGEGV